MARLSPLLNIIREASEKTSPSFRRDFGEIELLQSSEAGAYEFAIKSSQRIMKQLYELLGEARLDYGFIFAAAYKGDTRQQQIVEGTDKTHRWFIDPIAGFVNFSHAIPHFGVAVSLERTQDNITRTVASAFYDPLNDEFYSAENGIGAFRNHNRLRVSRKLELCGAIIGVESAALAQFQTPLREAGAHIRVQDGGAADYAWVAAGKLDALITINPPIWESELAKNFATESGGVFVTENDFTLNGGEAIVTHLREFC